MATNRESKIQILHSATAGSTPDVAVLDYGELAINIADEVLYFKGSDNLLKTFAGGPTGATGQSVGYTAGNTAPVGSNTGDFWYENDTGLYYAYVWDGSTLGWLQISGQDGTDGAVGATGATGATGPVGDYVSSFNGATGAIEGVSTVNGATGDVYAGYIHVTAGTPVSANENDFWFETDTGSFYAYIDEGAGLNWVEVSADPAIAVTSVNGATGDVKTRFPLVFNLSSTITLPTGQQLDFAQIVPQNATLVQTDLYVPDGCANATTDVFARLKKSTAANMSNSQANIDAAGITLELTASGGIGYNSQQIFVEGSKSGAGYFKSHTNNASSGNTADAGEYVYVYLEENDPSATNIIVSTIWEVR